MYRILRQKKSFRFALISALLTSAALGAAMFSAVAEQTGATGLSSIGWKLALGLAVIIIFYVVPQLARSIRLEYLRSEYSLHLPNAGLVFLALILIVTVLALSSGNNLLYLVLAVLLATMFVSWLASRLSMGGVSIGVRFPSHIFVGEAVPFDVILTNNKFLLPVFSAAVAIAEQKSTKPRLSPAEIAYLPIVGPRTEARSRIERSFEKRGIYPINGYVLGTRFPFGFIEQHRLIESPDEIVIYPKPQPLDDFVHLLPQTQGRVESHVKGNGSDLYAIRQYHSSDHHHHIDWKATAKTTNLMVREFTREDDWRVSIIFDPQMFKEDEDANDQSERFERAVTLTASLVNYFIEQGAEVRLATGADSSGFGMGRMHLYDMLRQLARIAPQSNGEESDDYMKDVFSPGSETDEQFKILITQSAQSRTAVNAPSDTHIIGFDDLCD